MEITAKQFKQFSSLVYQECGINLHDGKQQLLKARLAKRLRATGINSVHKYMQHLINNSDELVSFIDAISTNHTFFFRERHHFEHLQDCHQNIWCAASSSGEEPYSIAIHCMELGFKPSIHATDISTNVLQKGQQGIFPMEKAKSMPMALLKRYFKKGQGKWDGFIKVRDEIRNMVVFQRYNLVTDAVPSKQYDVIFCRNVLIYFDNQTKTTVVNKLHQALKKDGFLIIGGAESLNNINHDYRYVRPSVYAKKGHWLNSDTSYFSLKFFSDPSDSKIGDMILRKETNNMTKSNESNANDGSVNREREGKYLTFSMQNEEYGISILKIKEIIGMMPVTPVPQTPEFVKGVINLRGKVIPVVDLRLRFEMEAIDYTERTCIIVVEIESMAGILLIGIVVDAVSEVLNIKGEDIEDTPAFGKGLDTNFILGMAKMEGGVKTLLDIDRVLNHDNLAPLANAA